MQENRATISVCIMAFNEEKKLPVCLESFAPLADEIIVGIDDRTTDRTEEIAQEAGAITYRFKWEKDFAKARNLTLEPATSDWVFIADADNELPQEYIPVIRAFVQQPEDLVGSFFVVHKMKDGDSLQAASLRLFRRGTVRYKGRKHHLPEHSGKVVPIKARIVHTGFDLDKKKTREKNLRDERLLLMQIEEEPGNLFHYTNLARAYRSMERWKDVEKVCEQGLERTDMDEESEGWDLSYQMLMADYIYACLSNQKFDKGLQLAADILEKYSDNVDIWLYQGNLQSATGDFVSAINSYYRYIQELQMYTEQWKVSALTIDSIGQEATAWNNLGSCFQKVGRSDRSSLAMKRALDLSPRNPMYIENYAKCLESETRRIRHRTGRLRVLFVQRSACIRMAKMARALVKSGHDVGFTFQVETLGRYGLTSDFFCEVFHLPVGNNMGLLGNALERVGKDYDIIHCHNEPDNLTVAAIGVFAGVKPVIHDCHDLSTVKTSNPPAEMVWSERMALQRSDGAVFVSKEQAEQAHGIYGLAPGKSIILNNLVCGDWIPEKPMKKRSKADKQIHLVYQGGARSNGGHRDYRELFTEIAAQGIHVHIYPAFPAEDYKALAEDNNCLHYNDPVPPDKLLEEISQYDAGLIPLAVDDVTRIAKSVSMPNKLYEYLAVGLPVIARNLPALKTFITEKECGYVFNTAADLVKKLDKLKKIKIADELKQMTMASQIHLLEDFYRHLLGMRPVGQPKEPARGVVKLPVPVSAH